MTSCIDGHTRTDTLRMSLENKAKKGLRKKMIIVLALIALLEAFVLICVMNKSVLCENYQLLLYPVFGKDACSSVQGAKAVFGKSYLSSLSQETQWKNWLNKIVPKTPQILSELLQETPPNNHMAQKVVQSDVESKLKPTHTSDTIHESDMNVEDQPEDAATNPKDLEPKLERISFWMKLLRKAPNPYYKGAPCVWGYCYLIHRRHLPWGVRMENTSSHAIESSHSTLELNWDLDTMLRKEDIHVKASNTMLANAKEL